MIDLEVFAEEIGILANWFNRNFEAPTLKRLHERLSTHMNTEQFREACAVVFDNSKFFPSVTEFVQAVYGHQDLLASQEWNECVAKAARANPYDRSSYEIDLSPAGRMALRELGGLSRLTQMTDEREPWLKKEFLTLWKSYAMTPNHIALPEARTPEVALPQLKAIAEKLQMPLSD